MSEPARGRAEVLGDFGGIGLWVWNGGDWKQLTGSNPGTIAAADVDGDGDKDVVADFASGLWVYSNNAWSCIGPLQSQSLAGGDIDGDGRDEIACGACAIDHDGKGLYSTGLGLGDAMHLSDLDPGRPGLEVLGIHERPRHPHAVEMHDARTGKVLWSKASADVGRGIAMDIDPVINMQSTPVVTDGGATGKTIRTNIVVAGGAARRTVGTAADGNGEILQVFRVAAGPDLGCPHPPTGPEGMPLVGRMAGAAVPVHPVPPGGRLVFTRQPGQRPTGGGLDDTVTVEVAALAV